MKISMLTVFALFAATTSQFCQAALDDNHYGNKATTTDKGRGLRRHADSGPEPVEEEEEPILVHTYDHVIVEGVMITLEGPDSYHDPTPEEAGYVTDCLLTSYDYVEGDSGYQSGFAALEYIETTSIHGEGRNLQDIPEHERELWADWADVWIYLLSGHCNLCPITDSYVEDDRWTRRMFADESDEESPRLERLLAQEGSDWEMTFCRMLQNGPYEYFHSVRNCGFKVNKLRNLNAAVNFGN